MTNATIIKPKKKEKKSKKLTVKQIKLKARSKCQADCKLPDIVIQECLDNTKKYLMKLTQSPQPRLTKLCVLIKQELSKKGLNA